MRRVNLSVLTAAVVAAVPCSCVNSFDITTRVYGSADLDILDSEKSNRSNLSPSEISKVQPEDSAKETKNQGTKSKALKVVNKGIAVVGALAGLSLTGYGIAKKSRAKTSEEREAASDNFNLGLGVIMATESLAALLGRILE